MICDLAETYHIYNYRELPPVMLATLVVGLRHDSRTKMKINGMKVPYDTLILGAIHDRLANWVWMHTEDGKKKTNRPKSIVEMLTREPKPKENVVFDNGDEFDRAYQRIISGGK